MPVIELPNGERAEFPESMSLDKIKEVISKKFPPSSEINNKEQFNLPIRGSMPLRFASDIAKAHINPINTLQENLAGVGRGFSEFGQGLKQLYLQGAEKLGFKPPGTAEDYTREKDREAALYESTPASKNSLANLGRVFGNIAPFFPAGILGSQGLAGLGSLGRIAGGAAGGALMGGSQYAPEGGSHAANALLGGLLGGAIPGVPAALKSKYNPLNYSNKNIANNILSAKKEVINKYDNLYNSLWNDVKERKLNFNAKSLNDKKIKNDFKIIEKYTPQEKKTLALRKFLETPSTQKAHNAVSELKDIKRPLEKKMHLSDAEGEQYRALDRAIKYIENNMFKNNKGEIDKAALARYREISKGYFKENIPYTRNKEIQKYEEGRMKARKLVPRLREGEFGAQMEERHPELENQLFVNKLFKNSLLGLGGLAGADYFINKLAGK